MITINQCRAARGLLDWTQQDLADASGLSKTAINNFEKGHSDIKNESLRAIRLAFESADIEFLEEDGLRRRSEKVRILKGNSAFSDLLDDIYETLRKGGGEVLICNLDEDITANMPPKKLLEHLDRMKAYNIYERVICGRGVSTMLAPALQCRWVDKALVRASPTLFVYGRKVAMEMWGQALIVIIESRDAHNAERLRFEALWAEAEVPPVRGGARDSAIN